MDNLFFAKVRPDAIIPTKEDGNAGFDIYACIKDDEDGIIIMPNETHLIPTGIACAVSEGYYLQVEERGSTGSKGIKKSAGVIDSSYRGEIFIAITNCNNKPVIIQKKNASYLDVYDGIHYPYEKAIAQLVVHKLPDMNVKEISYEELLKIPSNRGLGKLGSSGK